MTREPDLDTLLREPIIRMLMERDGIASGELRQILQRVKSARAMQDRAPDLLQKVSYPTTGECETCGA